MRCFDSARGAARAAARGEPGEPAGRRAAPDGASISVETDGTPWAFTNPAQTTTDADGNLSVTLQRSFVQLPPPAPPPDTTAAPTVVTVRLGLVTNSVTVTF